MDPLAVQSKATPDLEKHVRLVPVRRWVEIADIRFVPQVLDPAKLYRLLQGGDIPPISLVKAFGVFYLWDGHHRFWIARIQGKAAIWSAVLDLDKA